MGNVEVSFFWNELNDEQKDILNILFDEAINTQKRIINFLAVHDKNGLLTETQLRSNIESFLPPSVFQWLVRYFRYLHRGSMRYYDIDDAEDLGHFDREKEPLLFFAKGRWDVQDGKPRLKLGEDFLKQAGKYYVTLPLNLPEDVEVDGPFKLALFATDLGTPLVKCYYRSMTRQVEEMKDDMYDSNL